MVMATQNPVEQEGTYPLPEAQMDRFLMHVMIGYPDEEAEAKIVRLVRGEESETAEGSNSRPIEEAVGIQQEAVFEARSEIHGIFVSEAVERYIVDLVCSRRGIRNGTGNRSRSGSSVDAASPRGAIALDRCARAQCVVERPRSRQSRRRTCGRGHDCLRHRLMLSYEANAGGISADQVIDELIKNVAVA